MKNDTITLAMGSGGRLSAELVEKVFLPIYGNEILKNMDDAAELKMPRSRIAFTTDSYTVKPIFFPGGDIGKLSVCGTVNDLSVKGARPLYISTAFIIEEGFPIADLKRIARSMYQTARAVGVKIVTGDTKVVSRSEADGIFINTAGIGAIQGDMNISCRSVRPGDVCIVSGSIGDHGMAIMNSRERLGFDPPIKSDVAPLWDIVKRLEGLGRHIRVMRDPTRGGLASLLNEIAKASRVTVRIVEGSLPVKPEVRACAELLGMDPLYIANEGKLALFVAPRAAGKVLEAIRNSPLGKDAAVIGVAEKSPFRDDVPPIHLETTIGAKRFVPLLDGELLPRIC
jgi:hydrogenase expression/formation protein HypE